MIFNHNFLSSFSFKCVYVSKDTSGMLDRGVTILYSSLALPYPQEHKNINWLKIAFSREPFW